MEIKCTADEFKELMKKEPHGNEVLEMKLLIQNLSTNLCQERILFYAVEQKYPGALRKLNKDLAEIDAQRDQLLHHFQDVHKGNFSRPIIGDRG